MADYQSGYTGEELDGLVGSIAAAFDSERSYAIGEFAYYNGAVYQRIKNPGAGGWVAADWALTLLSDAIYAVRKRMDNTELLHLLLGGGVSRQQMEAALAAKADKVSGAEAGNLAALDGNGNLLDSGKAAVDFGSARDVEILYKLAKGQLYDTQTDGTAAYSKTVPSGAAAAEIAEIGGKTVILHQLVTGTQGSGAGITVSRSENRYTYTLTSASASAFRYVYAGNGIVNHIYLYLITDLEYSSSDIVIRARRNGSFAAVTKSTGWVISKATTEDPVGFMMDFRGEGCVAGDTCSLRFQLFDLTEAFGAGNEPDSLEGFRAVFPLNYYDHTEAPQPISAVVTGVVSADADAETLDTLVIPDAIRALEGYGQSPVGGDGNTLNLADGTYTEIGHYVDGVWTLLGAPVVTDVSGLLAGTMVETEAGGTITFQSEAKLEVPNRVDYLIKLSEVETE